MFCLTMPVALRWSWDTTVTLFSRATAAKYHRLLFLRNPGVGGLGPGSAVLFLIQGFYELRSMLLLVTYGLRVLWLYLCMCSLLRLC